MHSSRLWLCGYVVELIVAGGGTVLTAVFVSILIAGRPVRPALLAGCNKAAGRIAGGVSM